MSLREEIRSILADYKLQRNDMIITDDVVTMIISIIEKRIDSILEEQIAVAKWKGNTPETDYIPVDKVKEMLK